MMKNLLTICFCWFALSVWGQQDTTFLYMDSLFQQLPEVLVRGERPVIKAEKGKLIYDVPRIIEKLPVTNAYEVLKELPGVTEQNGTLSLGGLRVTVVVNGKVTTLDKEQLRAMLEGTPVSRIEKAEIMYAAPARYQVRGPMINLILKSNLGQRSSLKGELFSSYEQSRREHINERATLLYTSGRFAADLMYTYSFGHTKNETEKWSEHELADGLHELTLNTLSSGYGGRHNIRLGTDYDFGKKNVLSMVYTSQLGYGQDRTSMHGTGNSDKADDGDRRLHNVKLDYQSSFGLTAGMDFTYFDSPGTTVLTGVMEEEKKSFFYKSNQRINRLLFYLNQEHALNNGWELNYGAKYRTAHDNSYQFYYDGETGDLLTDNSLKSRRTEYTFNGYAGFSKNFGKRFSFDFSLAAELYNSQTWHEWMLYPTLNANYRAKDGHMFQLSFSSNRSYPDYWSTQPTVQYVDSYTEVHGNPVLKPSSDYLAVLAYILKSKYVFALFYEEKPDHFAQLPYKLPDRLAEVNKFINYNFQRQMGIRMMAPYKIGKWWSGNGMLIAMRSRDKADDFYDIPFDRKKWVFVFRTSNTLTLSKQPDVVMNVSAFLQTKARQGIYDLGNYCDVTTSVKWTSPDKKAQLTLTGNDLFDSRNRMDLRIDYANQHSRTKFNKSNRNITLSFLYKFSGYKEKKRKEVDTSRLGH